MFRKSNKSLQQNLFTSGSSILSGKSLKVYGDKEEWHNQFREYVTMRIDEDIFRPLYNKKGKGAPNYPIRVLVSMMILKESQGISDEKLFEDCRFNLLIRSALGLTNIDSPLPTESTYYLFRKNVNDYARETGINLFEECFSVLTKNQCEEFNISGKRIRMDSKLLGSNIAWLSRYELVHETLSLFYKQIKGTKDLDKNIVDKLDDYLSVKGNKIIYTHSRDEVCTRLGELGKLIYKILQISQFESEKHYATLQQIFNEQFEVCGPEDVKQREKEQVSASSIQSPHDTDCTYRNKDGNQKKGYSINLTESCGEDNKLNLISDVKVDTANTADNAFFQGSVKRSQKVFTEETEFIHADGAYHRPDNQAFCKEIRAKLYLSAIQGARGKYGFRYKDDGELEVRILETGELIKTRKTIGRNGIEKWVIKDGKNYRYFLQKQINNGLIRDNIEETPEEEFYFRNNVEATIFQMGYHYPNDKSRYRGLVKHQMWVNIRCLWVNFVRISNYLKGLDFKWPKIRFSWYLIRSIENLLNLIRDLMRTFETNQNNPMNIQFSAVARN